MLSATVERHRATTREDRSWKSITYMLEWRIIKNTTAVAVAYPGRQRAEGRGVISNTPRAVMKLVNRLSRNEEKMTVSRSSNVWERFLNLVTAMSVTAELGDISQFESLRQLMAYLGLVPSEKSSGGKQSRGGIAKTVMVGYGGFR